MLSAAVGLAAALVGDAVASQIAPSRRFAMQAAGLPIAAVIYPAARSPRDVDSHVLREAVALVGYSALTALAARKDAVRGAQLLAAGWASHALFDLLHDGGPDSLIPDWYPGLCAGYDLGVAARLLQEPPARS